MLRTVIGIERQKLESGGAEQSPSQPISNGLLMLIRGNHIVISVLLAEIELESSAGFL